MKHRWSALPLVAAGLCVAVLSAAISANAQVNVTQHHNHASRDGLYVDPAFTQSAAGSLTRDLSFDGTIVGNVYAQPLYIDNGPGGRPAIIAATESNNVYALDAVDGSIIWQRNVDVSVSLSNLPCGNINPEGITGTPTFLLTAAVSRKTHGSGNFIYVGSGAPPPGRMTNYGLDVYSGQNGIDWDPVALSVYAPPTDEDLRDPALLPIGDTWWVVHTAGLFGNVNYFSLIKSTDVGQTWSWVRNVTVLSSGAQTWGPRWLVDSDGSIHVFVASHTAGEDFTLYEIHPTTNDLAGSWSAPVSTGITGYYDNWEMKVGTTYHFFVAHGGLPFRLYTSNTITGGAEFVADLLFDGSTLIGPENPTIFALGNSWGILLYDYGPRFATSSDLIHWSALTPVTLKGGDFSGAVATITSTFDIPLPLSGPPGVECRTGGATGDYTLVFTFSNNVTSGNASVTSGIGTVSGPPIFSSNTITVNLTGVADAQTLTVTLSGVTDEFSQVLPDTPVSVNVLIGDTNGNGTVNAADVAQIKGQVGQPVTTVNFRTDVNVSGIINAADVALVKSRSGF